MNFENLKEVPKGLYNAEIFFIPTIIFLSTSWPFILLIFMKKLMAIPLWQFLHAHLCDTEKLELFFTKSNVMEKKN